MIKLIDEIIVKQLKSRVLENSNENAQFVQEQMYEKSIFDVISNLSLRRRLLINLLTLNKLILSLHTFCENTKYLESCANVMKRLLRSNLKDIVQDTMRIIFN